MQITNIQTTKYNTQTRPNFGWLKICDGNICKLRPDGSSTHLPSDICILRKEDKPFFYSILEKWGKNTPYGGEIIRNFLIGEKPPSALWIKYNIFALYPKQTQNSTKSLLNQVSTQEPLGLALLKNDFDEFELMYIQKSPDLLSKKNNQFQIKGIGENLMYAMCRFICSSENKNLKIISSNDGFYSNIFKKGADILCGFRLHDDELNKFVQASKAKLKLPDTQTIFPENIVKEINNNSFI